MENILLPGKQVYSFYEIWVVVEHLGNPVVFPYYLSAFVSALRSVTYYLQKQYAHDERFKEWYSAKQEAMKADPVLKMLHEKCNMARHVEPFDLCFKQGWKMPDRFGGVITTTFLAVREEAQPDGQVRTFLQVEKDGPEEEVETQISWHFTDDDPQDVMTPCSRNYLRSDSNRTKDSGAYSPWIYSLSAFFPADLLRLNPSRSSAASAGKPRTRSW